MASASCLEGATVDSKKLEHGFGVIYAGVPSFLCVGIRGQSYSNFLTSTAFWLNDGLLWGTVAIVLGYGASQIRLWPCAWVGNMVGATE